MTDDVWRKAVSCATRNEARIEMGMEPIGFHVPSGDVAGLSPDDLVRYHENPWNGPIDVPPSAENRPFYRLGFYGCIALVILLLLALVVGIFLGIYHLVT